MYIPFNQLSPGARVWIYQSDRPITDAEHKVVSEKLRAFTEQWQVHGMPLDCSFDIRYQHFLILAANDTTSGCSIDSSVRIVKEIGESTGIDFFNRNLIAFKRSEEIRLIPLSLLKPALINGEWGEETPVFNNLVATIREVEEQWLVPAGTTWLKRYLAQPSTAQ